MALGIQVAVIAMAALLLTSAQLRVFKGAPPRRTRYVIAWLVCAIVLGAVMSYVDSQVGRAALADRLGSFAVAAVICAVALFAGSRLGASPYWGSASRVHRVLALLGLHVLIVFLANAVAR